MPMLILFPVYCFRPTNPQRPTMRKYTSNTISVPDWKTNNIQFNLQSVAGVNVKRLPGVPVTILREFQLDMTESIVVLDTM